MARWIQITLTLILFAPVVLMAGLMVCEAVPSARGWVAHALDPSHLWIAGSVFVVACLLLIAGEPRNRGA